jgi:diguanylate cyclase (GGDEF)-like protein/PAS domain S-box-containing protein
MNGPLRVAAAMLPLLAALTLQWLFWPWIDPYAWFLFYPAVLASSWIGGLAAGLSATAAAVVTVWWFFIPAQYSWVKDNAPVFPAAVFATMGIIFSLLHDRLRRSERRFRALFDQVSDERREAQAQARQAAIVFDNTSEAIVITDAATKIVAVNAAFTSITGYQPHEVLGQNPRFWRSGRHNAAFYSQLWTALNQTGHWRGEVWNQRKNGEAYPAWESISAVKDASGRVTHYVSMLSDITPLKQAEDRLQQLAHHDALTGLPNRLYFTASLKSSLERAKRHRSQVALLFLDLDRFKLINDSMGHSNGDELLKEVGRRLQHTVRAVDAVARLGGDEFTVTLEDIGHADDAARLADKLIAAIMQPLVLAGREVVSSVSIGIALYPDDADNAEDLTRAADAAMYRAKDHGRHTHEFYTPEIGARALEHLSVENGLRRALAHDELELYYQPQFELGSGRLAGIEGLLRWNHPDEGLLLPDRFIPVAEESGLIVDIGKWVIRQACAQARAWIDQGLAPPRIAINVSGRHILHDHLVQTVQSALQDNGLEPGRALLELEITESTLQFMERSADVLGRLRALGVRIAIDDFGTGFSSLNLLKHLPIDTLKIARVFVRHIPGDRDDSAIVSAMISMAHTLGLRVVAEGVETEAQFAFLLAQHCDEMQGHLRGAAESVAVMTVRLAATPPLRRVV